MNARKFRNALFITSMLALPAIGARAAGPERKVTVDQENLMKLCPEDQQRVLYIADRLEAITRMDRSGLSREERKAVREETRELKHEAAVYDHRAGGTVIYISGAGLLIILIIILILT